MKHLFCKLPLVALLFITAHCSSSPDENNSSGAIVCTPSEFAVDAKESSKEIRVVASSEWSVFSDDSWISYSPSGSVEREGVVTLKIAANSNSDERQGEVVLKSGTTRTTVVVKQAAKPETPIDPSIKVPDGYKLIWNDEFSNGTEPGSNWWYETGAGGWGNNELQHYVAGYQNSERLATVNEGILTIAAKKIENTVYSIRMNTNQSWKYGYFEARLKLPSGKGTWPAFWMMPKNFTAWPADGEIDIMEEVGYRPNYVSSAIHCTAYNHAIKTEKAGERYLSTAQSEFHVYALEWTEDYIRTYVDGEEIFYFANDKKGHKGSWPFNTAFYIKLNLAWGGNWGGAQGVDESALPANYQIDYVRVFQKK